MTDPVTIPLNATPRQSVTVPLSGSSVELEIYQLSTGLFMDVYLSGTLTIAGVLCQDRTWIIRKSCYGFPGDLSFVDTQGSSDPDYTGLTDRYVLIYQEGQNV
ncbi:hypothetical protein [Acetobacter sp. UBA5411]|uniref:phage baseplate plug family protein n=1 Tax=Acetobacter sp. UBA5411 TaxID=1945905 RepID=UPI0025B9CEF0|nr:hypothetical protein [Acetobacter sp. UBA5411]